MRLLIVGLLAALTLPAAAQQGDWSAVSKLKHHSEIVVESAGPITLCRLDKVDATSLTCLPMTGQGAPFYFPASTVTDVYKITTSRTRKVVVSILLAGDAALLGAALAGNDAAGVVLLTEGLIEFFYFVGEGIHSFFDSLFGVPPPQLPATNRWQPVFRRAALPQPPAASIP